MARLPQSTATRHRSSGVTLIEVLVALLVLSIGLLGVAALQANALQANHGSQLRSQATNLSYDIADRMRANRKAALDGDYDGTVVAQFCPADANDLPDPTGTLAQRDLLEWTIAMGCGLPGASGEIERDGSTFDITIRWDNSRLSEDDSDDVEEFVTRTEI
ncbi:type IV pilus modification protein PilV [Thioalkalivibrio sp. ALMg13-2]|uniref:type IV pilus modification protein PilV n=1 Tax=Thioalkalivibrio sp. ALMg13-2 TaxID=1158167 RepID=UPI000379DC3B|nr:type IV pilus modification protein PilV [Thioalkalivibrio sp. ALMg13-2]